MKRVDLHPEQLFDALRTGTLSPEDRGRLEAHCAECTACLFELTWVDTAPLAAQPNAEDRAIGEAAFDRVLRANKPVERASPERSLARFALRWGIGGVLLGVGFAAAVFFGRSLGEKNTSPKPPDASVPNTPHSESPRATEPAHVDLAPTPAPTETTRSAPPLRAAAAPSANSLLAAARAAQVQGRLLDSEHLYRVLLAKYPSSAAAGAGRVALARLLQTELAQPSSALPLFDEYLRIHPNGELVEEALYYRALVLDKLGRKQQAAESLRALLVAFPQSLYAAPARNRLSREPSR